MARILVLLRDRASGRTGSPTRPGGRRRRAPPFDLIPARSARRSATHSNVPVTRNVHYLRLHPQRSGGLHLHRHEFHGDWNYTFNPALDDDTPPPP